MEKATSAFFVMFIAILMLSACRAQYGDYAETVDVSKNDNLEAQQAYINVFLGDTGIFLSHIYAEPESAARFQSIFLDEYLGYEDEYEFEITHFLLIAVDGSNVPAVVLEVSPPYPGNRVILHYRGGTVYGYSFSFRSMRGIVLDGTFCSSGGVSRIAISNLQLSPSGFIEISVIGESDDIRTDEVGNAPGGTYAPIFFIRGEEVSYEKWQDFLEAHYSKEEAPWYAFYADTIAEDFAVCWNRFFDSVSEQLS